MDKKLNSYEKTELVYKQILADEENEKAKKIARLRELRLGLPSTGAQHEKYIESRSTFVTTSVASKGVLQNFIRPNVLMRNQALQQIGKL